MSLRPIENVDGSLPRMQLAECQCINYFRPIDRPFQTSTSDDWMEKDARMKSSTSTWKGQPSSFLRGHCLPTYPFREAAESSRSIAKMVALSSNTDSSYCISSYRPWMHTPPSLDFSGAASDDMSLSPLQYTAILQEQEQPAKVALSIQVRKARVLLFASVAVALLLTLIAMLMRGVSVKTIEGKWSEDAKRTLVNDYNFYSGTAASLVAKPFELCVAMLLPVLCLVFATEVCLSDDSTRWKMLLMLVQAGFVAMLTSALSSLNVQLLQPDLSPIVVASDLFSSDHSIGIQSQQVASDSRQLRPTTDTILRTAMQPTAVKSGENQCRGNGEWIGIAVAHSFPSNAWLHDMLPQGMEPTRSVQVRIEQVLKERQSQTKKALPFEMRRGANLLLHSMVFSEAILPWHMLGGNINSSYDKFLSSATSLEREDDEDGFLYAASVLLNSSLHLQGKALNYSVGEVTLDFTHFDISSDIAFDAVTIDIPFAARTMKRKLTLNDMESGLVVDLQASRSARTMSAKNASAVYDVATAYECGVDACLIRDEEESPEGAQKRTWNTEPQVHAFASCVYDAGTEDVTINYLHGWMCKERSNASMLIYSLGKRIVADEMVLDPPAVMPATQKGHFANIRKYQTITMGRLSWKTHDLAARFNAVCDASGEGCVGLSYQLEGNASRHLVVGEKHLPLGVLGPFEGTRSQWTPLVTVTTSVKGDLLFQRNVKKRVEWDIDWKCSDSVETFAKRVETNRWYMEHGLQEAYTSALFFLFQNAALREEWRRSDNTRTLAFAGSRVETILQARIPLQSAMLSICACMALLFGVFLAVIIGKRKEHSIQSGFDAHCVANMLLVDCSLPKVFLQCTLDDVNTRIKEPLSNFHIHSMCLKQVDRRHCVSEQHPNGVNGSAAVDDPCKCSSAAALPRQIVDIY